MTRLARRLGAATTHELHRISVEEPDRFWPAARRRPRDRVLAALGRGRRLLARARVVDAGSSAARVNVARVCLHRWAAERPDDEALVGLYEDGGRESLTWAEASRQATQLAEALVELGVGEGDRVAIFMPMCAGGRRRVARVRAHRRRAGADLLRLRGARDRVAARGLAGEGRDLRRLVAPPRQAHRDARDARRGRAARASSTWSSGTARRARGRERRDEAARHARAASRSTPRRRTCSPTRRARPAGRRARCTCRAASSSRSRARSAYQTDVKQGDRVHFATDMGWIMGPWTVVGARRGRRDDRLRRGRARLAGRPAVEARRVGARDDARPLAHARARADPERRADAPTSRRCRRSARPASRGTPTRTAGSSSTSAAARRRS